MGNTHVKPHPRRRNKKQVHWKAADHPAPPGKPHLASDNELTPDLVTIRWSKPVRDGGSPITGYLVEHRRTGSPHWVRATPLLVPIPEITLSGLEPGWRYQFRVSAENAVGLSDPSEVSEPLTVTLQKFAITAPKFLEELQDVTVLENEKVEFVVHLVGQPAPKVCWFKDGFEIFSSRRTRILTEADKSILTIHQTSLSDEGEIKCTATNKAGHASTKAKLTLEAPPSIRLPRQYEDGLLFEIGEVIRLKVSVVGRPTPLVFWSHNGESLQNNDRYEIEYVDRCSVLKLGEATRFDRGEYQIKAVNKIGEDVVSFLVTVTDKPSPPSKARVVMTLGRSVTLSWGTPADDGGCKIGNYIVEYYRLGWNVWLKAATSRQLSTILGDLIEGSEYKFRVKAESPYGVSDPSEESEIVFIPDPRRGITTPQARSKSQPKDYIDELASPVPTTRRTKGKPRSQSATKPEYISHPNGDIPQRPVRTKVKSPPKTPEMSNVTNRKTIHPLSDAIFDRASMARELAYGSPEIKVKKVELNLPQNNYITPSSSERSYSTSPTQNIGKTTPLSTNTNSTNSPSPLGKLDVDPKLDESKLPSSVAELNLVTKVAADENPSPKVRKKSLTRENSDNFGGSSEFMLVLYPDKNEKGRRRSDVDFDFDDISIPPPMSLSAPELGAEPPLFENLKLSASSTELLHERAMIRFNEAAALEEMEKENRRRVSFDDKRNVELPKIQINSKDDANIVGLELKNSGKRRLSGGNLAQQQSFWAQRRNSLRNTPEFSEFIDKKMKKLQHDEKVVRPVLPRQRSESEEKEEQEFEKVRAKMALQNQSSFEKRSIEVVDEDKWLEDYEESLSEEETTESSEDDERYKYEESPLKTVYSDEDEEIYHPGAVSSPMGSVSSAPFEILTKQHKLPDPNFVPKPILKRPEDKPEAIKLEPIPAYIDPYEEVVAPKIRSHSPMPQFRQPEEFAGRKRSSSLGQSVIEMPEDNNNTLPTTNVHRKRSFSLIPEVESPTEVDRGLAKVLPESLMAAPGHNISAVAQLTGLTAASVIISGGLLKKKEDEEAKIAAEHYGDIVRTFSEKRKYKPSSTLSPMQKYGSASKLQDSPQPSTSGVNGTRAEQNNQHQTGALFAPTSHNSILDRYSSPMKQTVVSSAEPITSATLSTKTVHPSEDDMRPPEKVTIDIIMSKQENTRAYPLQTPQDLLRSQREKSLSPRRSPTPQRRSPTPQRGRSERRLPRKGSKKSKTPSKSPIRLENWSGRSQRKTSPSPMKRTAAPKVNKSPSPVPLARHRPILKEIMTQTSVGLELDYSTSDSRTSSPVNRRQEELMAQAEIKVRSALDYTTDLAMFAVACWFYLFSNELWAIPVLIVMVYRQLRSEIGKRIPKWIVKRLQAKPKKN